MADQTLTVPLWQRLPIFIGRRILAVKDQFTKFGEFLRATGHQLFRGPFRSNLVFQQMEFIGNESLTIIMISGFFIGAVFSLQIGSIFAIFGAQGMMGAATGKSLARELSPLLVGFLLAGRGGAAITAEIATMKVNEQVDAMESMAVDPISYLVCPRLIAGVAMMPLLTGIFTFTGMIGSLAVGVVLFNVDQGVFFDKLIRIVGIKDIWSGMQKALAFGAIITLIACRYGLVASGGAKGVGKATTNSVVVTLLVLLGVDFLITYFQVAVLP